MTVKEYILNTLQRKYTFNESVDIETFNYVDNGYVDSLGLIQFVAEIEDKFDITFSEEELSSSSFQVVGELIKIIEIKISGNNSRIS